MNKEFLGKAFAPAMTLRSNEQYDVNYIYLFYFDDVWAKLLSDEPSIELLTQEQVEHQLNSLLYSGWEVVSKLDTVSVKLTLTVEK